MKREHSNKILKLLGYNADEIISDLKEKRSEIEEETAKEVEDKKKMV